jgi:hypothetical protein
MFEKLKLEDQIL